MSALRGVVVGTLVLTGMEAAVTSSNATGNVSTLIGLASQVIRRLVDPTVPLIPDLRSK